MPKEGPPPARRKASAKTAAKKSATKSPKKKDAGEPVEVEIAGKPVTVTNPGKIFFPKAKITKLDLAEYYAGIADHALVGARDRPCLLLRFPNGVDKPAFFQKRVPTSRPEWIETVTIKFPSGREATMIAMADAAHLVWSINLGCIGIDPWPIRKQDVEHPDELRFDLDPTPGIKWADVRQTAHTVREVLQEHSLEGFPKTSGKRGMHIVVRIKPEEGNGFRQVRRAGIVVAREVERRLPGIATTAWWKEERRGVFVDYNQNARDRTTASAYAVRAVPNAQVSTPLTWDEVDDAEPADFTVATVPARVKKLGDPGAAIDEHAGSIATLLEAADRAEAKGEQDAPWPPQFPKEENEPVRAAPSRRKEK